MSWRDALLYLMPQDEDPVGARPVGSRAPGAARPIGGRPSIPGITPGKDFGVANPIGSSITPESAGFSSAVENQWGRGWGARMNVMKAMNDAEEASESSNAFGVNWNNPMQAMIAGNSGVSRPVEAAGANAAPSVGQSSTAAQGGGAWKVLDQWDEGYNAASTLTGVPANVIKAFQAKETGRADYVGQENCEIRPESGCVALNTGIFEDTAKSYGLDYARIRDDPEYAAYATGVVLQHIATDDAGNWGGTAGKTVLEDGGWEGVARVYYGGSGGYTNPNWQDERGVGETAGMYASDVMSYVSQLDARGTSPGQSGQSVSSPNRPASSQVGNYSGSAIADLADDYTGVDYVWGSLPTEDQDPYATGWDCSGFVSFIMDRLGYSDRDIAGGVPNGSHYQAEWAIDTGRWSDGMDLSQMQPGDLIFFDTGAEGGGGQNEVSQTASRATHVGIYLGDGKMINAMQQCGPGLTMGVDCGTGIVSVDDGYWANAVIGWADTSDIIGGAATERGGAPPANITGQGAASTAPVSTPAPSGTLPIQNGYGSTGNVR